MSTRPATRTIARRCLEILDQMARQLQAARGDAARRERIRADLTRLVHLALHDRGDPDVVARIRDCYRRCAVDIDDAAVLRQARGVIKGELRKAGIDAAIPGLEVGLDAATIILTARLTIRRMGGASSSTSAPGPALDRKRQDERARPPARPVAEPPPPAPHTLRAAQPTTARRAARPATVRRAAASPAEMQAAFDRVVDATLARIRAAGRGVERPDYLAAVYNDPPGKERLAAAVAAAVPHADRTALAQAIDGFFRNGFKGHYIERTDRQGHRRAHRR